MTAAAAPVVPPTDSDVPVLFRRLLDDAAIFPPGNAVMGAAVLDHVARLRTPDAPYVGAFLCTASRLEELLTALPDDVPHLDLTLVVPGGVERLPAALEEAGRSHRLVLRAVEVPADVGDVAATSDALDALLPPGVPGYVEVPLTGAVTEAVGAVAARGHRVKLRTGGTRASAFPTAAVLARGLAACVLADVPFKLTAGLHHAVRHRDRVTGFEHHGFLNVLVAVSRAACGCDPAALTDLLEERAAAVLAQCVAELPPAGAAQLRSHFVAFGTCSTTEPLADLRAMGLVPHVGQSAA